MIRLLPPLLALLCSACAFTPIQPCAHGVRSYSDLSTLDVMGYGTVNIRVSLECFEGAGK